MRKIATKLVSAILVLSLLTGTVLGCLSVSAASTNTYAIVADSVAAGTKKTTVEVTITGDALTSGSFDLMFGKDIIDDVNFDENGNYVTPKNETVEEFRDRDTDGNFMITGVNYYKEETYESPIYNAEGEITGYETKTRTVIDTEKSFKENTGNKGVLLPNAYDGKVGLYDTKIEITGGTRADGTAFNIADFTNANYADFAKGEGNTTNAIEGAQTINGVDYKYVYNMTDGYDETHYNSNPVNRIEITEGEETKTVIKQDVNLLDKYYREYTTVDVATANLGYKISTVSEDSVSPAHAYMQYAQGFKDITYNSSAAYTSITFTVTFDFSGNCDRINANEGIDADKLTGTTNVDGETVNYRNNDGRWGSENYIQYNAKYALNFVGDGFVGVAENSATNYFHVHDGVIENNRGTDEPVNKAAIDALLQKNPNAKEGVDYFELYNARCQKCNRITPMIAAPDLPYQVYIYDEAGNRIGQRPAADTKGVYSYNNFRNISGVNAIYENDGTVALNIHYPSKMDGEQMFITDENGMIMKYSDILEVYDDNTQKHTATASNAASSKLVVDEKEIARYGDGIISSAHMITISGFSAADIDKTLYVARYTPSSSTETQLMGITHMISVRDYLNEVIKNEENTQEDKLVAAALLNYANASTTALGTKKEENPKVIPTEIDLLEFGDYLKKAGSTSTYYDTKVADNGETGAEDDPIIIDSAEELVYLCKASGNETYGKYYKVADNILAFDLSKGNLDFDGTLADNLAKIQGSGKNHSGNTPGFQGHFDGNGATVYGAWGSNTSASNYSGLFSCAQGDVTIKNINVKLSSFTGKISAGGIVGYYMGEGNFTSNTTLTIENCSVTDCHIEVTGTGYGYGVGAIVGRVNCPSGYKDVNDEDKDGSTTDTVYVNNKANIKNCYVNLDEKYFVSKAEDGVQESGERVCHGGVVGVAGSNALMVSNCVVIGITPYATSESTSYNDVQHSGLESHFTNVYTTSDVAITGVYLGGTLTNRNFTGKVIPLTDAQLKGLTAKDNMSKLNWDTIWCANDGDYPSLYAPYNIPEVEPKTIYWDGSGTKTAPTEGSGTKDDPYIIYTVAELAYIFGQTRDNYKITDGKYYKISDTIANIVLQPETYGAEIMALKNAAETKAYFEANASKLKKWTTYGWESSTFCGDIDFNGVTIYGIYQTSTNNTGLISNIDGGAAIHNVTIKNSYMTSSGTWNASKNQQDYYQVAVVAGVSNGDNYGKKVKGIVWFDSITIANNYLYNTSDSHDRSGVLMGAASDCVYTDNCFVYGNDATYGAGVNMPLIGTASNSVPSTVKGPDGLVTKIDATNNGENLHFNMVRNSIILGCNPYDAKQGTGSRFNDARAFQNVYTDAQTTNVQFTNEKKTFTPAQLTRISANEIVGLDAKEVMPLLDWNNALTNPDGAWYCSYIGMPSLTPLNETVADVLPEYSGIYNSLEFVEDRYNNADNGIIYEDDGTMKFGVYATSINLSSKPYMSFAFAFHGDYKTNRDKIKVRFTYTLNGTEHTVEGNAIPVATDANGDGKIDDIKNVNGWTNRFSAGRYHTYRFTDLPIGAIASDIKVEASYDGGEWLNFGTFSIGGLGYEFEQSNAVTPDDYYTKRAEAVKALMAYAYALQTRYGA
ncbi:MAG: hypothetical protein IKU82_05205 [Clostridia bacterium]|nr:hypothetical protein [Clostridia bacterium]